MPKPRHARRRERQRTCHMMLQRLCAVALAILISACGGGGSAIGDGNTVGVAGLPAHTMAVRTIDSAGRPVAGVSVSLNGGFDGTTGTTDADGNVQLTFRSGSSIHGAV